MEYKPVICTILKGISALSSEGTEPVEILFTFFEGSGFFTISMSTLFQFETFL